MKRSSVLYLGFVLSALVCIFNLIALKFYLYWTLDWYDYPMHFLGGFTIGVLAAWLVRAEFKSWKSFCAVFIGAMLVGILWEIFEYMFGITGSAEGYAIDTVHDLIMDALGVVLAYIISVPNRLS